MTYAYSNWQAGDPTPKGFDVAEAVENGWTQDQVMAVRRANLTDDVPEFPDDMPAVPPKRSNVYSFADWKAGKRPPKGWDVADAIDDGWSKDDLQAMMRAAVCDELPPFPVEADTKVEPASEPPALDQQEAAKVSASPSPGWERDLIEVDGKVKLDAIHNWMLVTENHRDMVGVIGYDRFRHNIMLVRCPPWESPAGWVARPIEQQDRTHLVMWLEHLHFKAKPSNIDPVILAVAQRNSFDPLVDYLTSIRWDGTPRAERWLTTYLGADDADYTATVGYRFLISAVARGLRPGCKVDTMPILEGAQGLRKSSALEALFSKDFFTDHLSGIGSKDAMMEMQGVWGLEVAELDQFSRAETGMIKKFLTQKVDRFRPPYGKDVIAAPRRCVLAGTINPDGNGYLRDPTGGRRFWPVACRRIDVEALHCDRDQLWAEAVHAFNAEVPWWVQEAEAEAVIAQQSVRTDTDAWSDIISEKLKGEVMISQREVLEILGHQSPRDIDRRVTDRVSRVMISLGWQKIRDQSNGMDRTVYRRAGQATAEAEGEW